MIEKNIPHNVLNASNAFWEAQIIAGAGQLNAVTVATTMAGRGTDIKLGDGVKGAWRLSCHRYRQDEQFKIREAGEGPRRQTG